MRYHEVLPLLQAAYNAESEEQDGRSIRDWKVRRGMCSSSYSLNIRPRRRSISGLDQTTTDSSFKNAICKSPVPTSPPR